MSGGGRRREIAHRLFATEYDDAIVTVADSTEEMAPTYVLAPSGALVNRVFVVGALTEVDQVGDDIYRGRINDPTGTFIAYAGQYQPDAANFLAEVSTPAFVSVTAKARTFEPERSEQVLTSLRPERIVTASRTERDRWVTEAARHTFARIEWFARARGDGVPDEDVEEHLLSLGVRPIVAQGIARAKIEYDTSATYLAALRERTLGALEVVFGDGESVPPLQVEPGDHGGSVTYGDLATDTFADLLVDPDADVSPREALATVGGGPGEASPEPEASTSAPDDTPGGEPSVTEEVSFEAAEEPVDLATGSSTEAPEPEGIEEYELTDEERERIESEFGTEFETGSDIDSPSGPVEDDRTIDADDGGSTEPIEETDEATVDDLEDAVVEQMHALDDGDGVDREVLIDAVRDATDAQVSAIEDAIRDALMSGSCYEPQEGRLKPI